MNCRCSLKLDGRSIEKIQNRLGSVPKCTLVKLATTHLNRTLKQIDLEESGTKVRRELHHQTVRLDTNHRYELERLRLLSLICLTTITLQLVLFYSRNPPQELLLNCISFMSAIGLVVQVAYAIIGRKVKRLSNLVTVLLMLMHPNVLTPAANTLLHIVLLFRIGLVVEWRLKTLLEYKPQAARVLRFSESIGDSRLVLGFKSLMKRISVASIIKYYLILNLLLAHCLFIASNTSLSGYSYSDILEIITSTFTRVGSTDVSNIDNLLKQTIIYVTIMFGIVMNGFVVLSSVARLDMNNNQQNAHRVSKLLEIQNSIEESSAKFLMESAVRYENKQVRRCLYRKFKRETVRRRICTTNLRRNGIIEFLTLTYRSELTRLATKQRILNNLVAALVGRLRR